MKQIMIALLVIGVFATCTHASNEIRRGRQDNNRHRDQSQAQINDIIYDLTIPWPFHKPHGIDADGDGVVDALDRCPGTPPSIGVDRHGCPIDDARTVFLDTGNITVYGIKFDTKEAGLKSSSHGPLNEIGQIIEDWPELKIEINGHTDSKGETEFNQELSEQRAQNVRSYLLGNFDIEPSQLVAVGHGELRPVASNDTEDGRALNRRVEFKVLNKRALKKTTKGR